MNDEVSGAKWTEQGKPCPVCGERFYDKHKMREHRAAAHPVACPQCGKAFVTEDGVRLHAAAVHGAPTPGPGAAGPPGDEPPA